MNHNYLVKIAAKWLSKSWRNSSPFGHGACSVVITELTTHADETPDAIGFHGNRTTLIECKATVSDFKADSKKHFRKYQEQGMGNLRYYMAPKGVIRLEDTPIDWGLIEVSEDGKTDVIKNSKIFSANHIAEKTLLLSLIRRANVQDGNHCKIRIYRDRAMKKPRATSYIADHNMVRR